AVAGAAADEHVVGAVAEGNRNGDHDTAAATRSTTSSRLRSSTSTMTSATSEYIGVRSCDKRASSVAASLPASSGRSSPAPTRDASVASVARNHTTRSSPLIAERLRDSVTAPPPTDSTDALGLARNDARTSASRSRNAASPRVWKMVAIDIPSSSSIHASTSKNGRPSRSASSLPTDDFPAPIIPTSTMCSELPEAGEVAITVAEKLVQRVTAELAQGLTGQDQRGHRLGHHTHGGDSRDVGALLEGDRLFLGLHIDGAQHGAVERRERLHRHP